MKKKAPSRQEPPSFFKKYRLALLVLVPFVVYVNVISLDYTCIDDAIFIIDNKAYNQDASNIAASFERGLFQPADKTQYDYYRPLFLVDMIVEYHLFGDKAMGYHITNLLFHILSVVLLFLFLRRIKLGESTSLLLALLFAVHPAISHAVAWIPGRNDMMLMIFLLSGMIFTIRYAASAKWFDYGLQLLFFLLALFTKETAVIIPLLAFFILIKVLKTPRKPLILLFAGWFGAIGCWFFMESTVKQSGNKFPVEEMLESGASRMPAFVQYLGKIFLPFNLSVHPQIDEISLVWGLLSLAALIALVVYSRSYFKPLTILGFAWFILFLLPVLAVPKTFNDLMYEHRLYIPIIGILLVLSQTLLFSDKFKEQTRFILFGMLVVIMGTASFFRAGYFESPLVYWSRAVVESQGNAYSKMMMATWVTDEAMQEKLFREAYAIDSNMKDINLYLGKVAFKNNRYEEAERHLKKELTITPVHSPDQYFILGKISFEQKKYSQARDYTLNGLDMCGNTNADAYFLIAQSWFMENNLDSAAFNLQKVIDLDPGNTQAINNIVLVYVQLGRKDEARALIQKMRDKGQKIPQGLIDMVGLK